MAGKRAPAPSDDDRAWLSADGDARLQHLGLVADALAAGHSSDDIARVLIRTALSLPGCGMAGLLLLAPFSPDGPSLFCGADRNVSAPECAAMIARLLDALDPRDRPSQESIHVVDLTAAPAAAGCSSDRTVVRTVRLETPELRIGAALLACGSRVAAGRQAFDALESLARAAGVALNNARLFTRATDLAVRDGVTGLYNRGHLDDLLTVEISRALSYEQHLALIMLDVDHEGGLKVVNDTLGHLAGDELLRQIGEFLLEHVRRADAVARYGGDEFAILAPGTSATQARALSERICDALGAAAFPVAGSKLSVTVSVGVAVWQPGSDPDTERLIESADRAMYRAKLDGGNCVRMARAHPGQEVSTTA